VGRFTAADFTTMAGASGAKYSTLVDRANAHIYQAALVPPRSSMDDTVIPGMTKVFGASMPAWITEYGDHSAKNAVVWDKTTHTPTTTHDTHIWTPEDISGRYAPRMLFELILRKQRGYFYEFVDEASNSALNQKQDHFGMLAWDNPVGTYGGSSALRKKPIFTALKNTLAICADTGTPTSTGLDVALTGGGSDLRHQLLAVSDGSYRLALWRTVSIYNPGWGTTGSTLTPASNNITVTLTVPRTWTSYTPYTSGTGSSLGTGLTQTVAVAGDLIILKLV
jgi:hypothetical protein